MLALAATGAVVAALTIGAPASALPATVSSTGLPTAQLNGVAVTQVVIGHTVYVGGSFTTARPAGAAPGTHTRKRGNLLAYNLTTGVLTSWAPKTNGEVEGLAKSANGKTIYAVGHFTTVNGHVRQHVVAIAASTGHVVGAFHPKLNGNAYAVAVKGATVYVGGGFTSANGMKRSRAASFSTSKGVLRAWRPKVNDTVFALVISKSGTTAVLGGRFSVVNGRTALGSAKVGTTSGTTNDTWKLNTVVQNFGDNAAVWSLTSSATYVYGTGYQFASPEPGRKLEGVFVASWKDGTIRWMEDCHGDTYSAAATKDVVYIAGHPHDCQTVPGGFLPTTPTSYHRALAFTNYPTGVLTATPVQPYSDFAGEPAPTLLAWRPDFDYGSYTGTDQGPWNVVASGGYVLYAGEFTTVNGVAQQGLVRFGSS
jgi:hypothetical protein